MKSTLIGFFDELEHDFDFEYEVKQMLDNYENYTQVKYTIYIPSKGRSHHGHTVKLLESVGLTNYKIVVEPQDYKAYKEVWGDKVIQMELNDQGIAYARSFIKRYSKAQGEEFHWQIDDDMKAFQLRLADKNTNVNPIHCFAIVETVNDKFTNVGISCITSNVFAWAKSKLVGINKMTYGVVLIRNDTPCDWRVGVSEDLDYTLQNLECGLCTLSYNRVIFSTFTTGTLDGGNMLNLFVDDGRKQLYENTAELWPGIFIVKKLDNDKGWGYQITRKMKDLYKQMPKLKTV